MSFADFILSDNFIPFMISFVVNLFAVPGAAIGWPHFARYINRRFLKPGQGYIEVRHNMPNSQEDMFLAKPTGKFISVKDTEGKSHQIPVNLTAGWFVFRQGMPVVTYDKYWQQQKIEGGVTSTISPEDTTKGWRAAYETGKFIGLTGFMDELKKMLMIIAIFSIAGMAVGAVNVYMNYSSGHVAATPGVTYVPVPTPTGPINSTSPAATNTTGVPTA